MKKIIKKLGKDFFSDGGALTLTQDQVCSDPNIEGGFQSRTHKDGWTIRGRIHEDYFVWVNEFYAEHKKYGKVWGDFEDKVYADSEEGFKVFFENHPPKAWDYGEI